MRKFKPEEYTPIDYTDFVLGDEARNGINIKKLGLLNEGEENVFNEAIQYNDGRNDPGQAEMVTILAIKLLEYLPGKREIAVPTSICHDIGFYGTDPDAWDKLVVKHRDAKTLGELDRIEHRLKHQYEGVLLTEKIFTTVNYPPKQSRNECYGIINDHDTQLGPTTDSGILMRSADRSWRTSLPCNEIYRFKKGKLDPKEAILEAEEVCLNADNPKNLQGIANEIGRIELANTIITKFPDQAEEVLRLKYAKEYGLVRKFYDSLN